MGQNEIERYAGAILNDPRFQKLRSFEHHGPANTVYDHSLAVTRVAYRIACALHLSEEETASVVRAALLHDFFGYDWHSEFPLAPIPRSRIAWIVTLADKAVASREVTLAAGDYIALAYHRVFA